MSDQNLDRKVRTVVILVTIGTIAWLIAGLIAVVIGTEAKIIWTCVFGALLGATGVRYSIRRAKRSGI
jgi:NhaP-type Na+/H+ or K+/H+ antiporter